MSSLTEGLVGHWKFDESYGTSFSDVSGYNNSGTYYGETFYNGTISGGAEWITGKYDGGLSFDGVDDYVSFSRPHSFATNLEGAYSFWFRLDTIPSNENKRIFEPGTLRLDVSVEQSTGKLFVWFHDENDSQNLVWKASDDSYVDGNWHNITVNKTSTSIDVYVDTSQVGTYSTTLKTYDDKDYGSLGSAVWDASPPSNFADVDICGVRIYNRALSTSEITRIYNNEFIRSGMVLYYRFSEGSSDTVYDSHHISYSTNPTGSRYGNALSFDGVDDYFQTYTAIDLDLTSHGITLSAWVYPNYSLSNPFWASWEIVGNWAKLAIGLRGTEQNVKVGTYLSGHALWFSIGNRWDSWIHIVARYHENSSKRDLYIDGQYIGSDYSGDVGNYTSVISIGKNNYTSIPFGLIDDVRIYNRVLTETEIRGLYNLYGAGSAKLIYSGSSYFYFYPTRWDEDNWSVVIETFLTDVHRDLLFANVVPGAVRELYNYLGLPIFIDTTFNSGNTLTIVPISPSISGLRKTRRIAVKSISDTFINPSTYKVKIEGLRLDTEDLI